MILDIDSSDSPVPGAGAVRVQRPLRVRLLSPTLRLQPRGRLPGGEAATGERPQCGGVGRGPVAHHRWVPPTPTEGRAPGGRCVLPARDLRGAGTPSGALRDPAASQ